MSELKLEAGKTYVYKDDQARQEYLESAGFNRDREKQHYACGFTLSHIHPLGSGYIGDTNVISEDELKYFKLKEEPSLESPKEPLKASTPPSEDLLQQLVTRLEALEQQLKVTTDKEIPLGQAIKSFHAHSTQGVMDLDKATLGEITEAINYLSSTCNSVYDIFYLALFPEADGSYSGSIFQSMVGSGQDDVLWAGFDRIII